MQDNSTLSRQKKDAESNWKSQVNNFVQLFILAESVGSSPSPFQKFANDGLYDVDGWKYGAIVQHWYHIFSSLATHKCSSRSWKK
ncbi:hypothetical protein Vadar_015932 [Vaccinium darrowii]|uniref:Uncharacterized protein n=1 Tax=Vaccinium darrowii TaxID=229202 RepID=A0ACB7XHV2_9ERIC|nr:hypothetical protein Vadar_015932 [Vaccinium darrowii]